MRGKPFEPGNSGRPVGSQNKLTKTIKQTLLAVFEDLQADQEHNLMAFAKKYPREFYAIVAKLIPYELPGEDGSGVKQILINFKDAE